MKDRDLTTTTTTSSSSTLTATASLLSKGDFSSTTNLHLSSTSSSSTPEPPRRKSTSSATRPSAADIYSYYPYVPKVKLGPRPVPHVEAPKRPHTASNDRTKHQHQQHHHHHQQPANSQSAPEELRAAVPRSVHLPLKKSPASAKATTLAAPSIHSIPQPTLPPSPDTPTSLYSFSIYSSTASLKSAGTAAEGPTPEKQRLMRALQLRRQQQQQLAERKLQDKVDEHDNSPTAPLSGDHTPTVSTMPINDDALESIATTESVTAAPIRDSDTSLDKVNGTEILPSENEDNSADAVSEVIDSTRKVEDHEPSSGNGEAEAGDEDAKKKKDKFDSTMPDKTEPEVEAAEADAEGDKLIEGTTKVRDDVDEESDGESTVSLEAPLNESRTTQPAQVPAVDAKGIQQPAGATDSSLMPPPKSTKRLERSSTTVVPVTETPVLESARSVSAPFLKSARPESKPAVAKKVTVGGGGGSVSQRIRQFQQLASTQKKPAQNFNIPPRTPSRGSVRSNSPTPEFLANRPQSAMSNKSPPRAGSISGLSGSLAPGAMPLSYRNSMPPPPLKEPIRSSVVVVDRDNRPQLQVTTKISRDDKQMMSPSLSPQSSHPSLNLLSSPTERVVTLESSALPLKSFDVATDYAAPTSMLRRSSTDAGSSARNSSRDREGRSRLFSRSPKDKDLDDVPEMLSPTTRSRSGSGSSIKSPKSPSFLKRVSESLTRRKDPSPPPPPPKPPAPVESAQKKYLHVGSINVQLPDTMLWKRRFMKIDSDGWLFLSLTDDEVCYSRGDG
ncbi:hypothetical protein FN846DRAFT_245211 [Sphaerosporella brunnea]|uniref:PH domain-containing protein n=1 Tax=Sphaerosporella brunnea TaxID=1250544 RepID=A0A5J5FC25_9PEZI|nr:hypothetical protein FN846DRAFT_245211 [Sphaerosporella brunnea]